MSTPTSLKIVLLGSSGVGKSSLGVRFAEDRFVAEQESTLGAAYLSKTMVVKGRRVRFNIWDTAGQERYRAMAKMYYQDAQAAILVYDVTARDSFTDLRYWHRELLDNGPEDIAIAVVGNKQDLVDREAVSVQEARKWADSIHASFHQTSSKMNSGIETLFVSLLPGSDTQDAQSNVKLAAARTNTQKGCQC